MSSAAKPLKFSSNSYFMVITTMGSGKQFRIPCRGYNLRSWLDFEASLKLPHFYVEVPKEEYDGYYNLTDGTEDDTIKPKKRKPKSR
jgi:hypothetical protein